MMNESDQESTVRKEMVDECDRILMETDKNFDRDGAYIALGFMVLITIVSAAQQYLGWWLPN